MRIEAEAHAERDRILADARKRSDEILERTKVLDAHFKSTIDKIASG